MAIDRIASFGSSQLLTSRLLRMQSQLHTKEVQMASQKVSQTYAGLARDSQLLVNMETGKTALDRYIVTNQTMEIKVSVARKVVGGIQVKGEDQPTGGIKGAISDFRNQLVEFQSGSMDDPQRVKDIQDRAFTALRSIEVFLNEDINNQFIFAGTKSQTQPVDLGLSSLAAFQSKYDGETNLYPWTRDAHVNTELTTSDSVTGNIHFDTANNMIVPDNADTLSSIPVGSLITVSGGVNDGMTFTVVENTPGGLVYAGNVDYTGAPWGPGGSSQFTVAAPAGITDTWGPGEAGVTLSVSSYYKGDRQETVHRLGANDTINYDFTAADPAFEKAIRAMSIIAQGEFGTTGGLDQNQYRADEAYWLLSSALSLNNTGTPPFGPDDTTIENRSNIEQLDMDLGFFELTISKTNTKHQSLISFYDDRIGKIEDIDTLTVVSELLSISQAMEASYQAMARVRQLSLHNFL